MARTETDQLVVSLEARITQFEKNLLKAQKTAARSYGGITSGSAKMAARMQADFNRTAAVASQLRGTIGIALGAIGASSAINVIRNMEKLRASLQTVTGSADGAAQAFDMITKLAATTPFSVEQVTQAFIKLKALGLDPSEKAIISYGNTAAAMGKGLDQMIEAVADAATGEFERLKEFGIRASSQGDRVTFTFRGISRTVGKNAAEIEAYLRNIGETDFAGAMDRQAKTLDGALSNLSDSTTALIDKIGQAGLGAAIADLARELSDTAQDGQGLATILGETLGGAVDNLTERLRNLNKTIAEFQKGGIIDGLNSLGQAVLDADPAMNWIIKNFGEGPQSARRQIIDGNQLQPNQIDEFNNAVRPGFIQAPAPSAPVELNVAADKLSGLDDKLEAAVRQLVADAEAAGHAITVTSALRSTERQRQLWQEALAKYGSPAAARQYVAPPGTSKHEKGTAVDIAFPDRAAREWVAANMGAYGLAAPVKTETPLGTRHAHLELAGSRSAKEPRDEAAEAAKRQEEAYKGVVEQLRFEGEQLGRNTLAQEIALAQRQAGVEAASDQGQAIADLVTKNYELQAAQEAAKKSQEAATERAGQYAEIAKSAVGGLISDLRNGVSAADAFANALDRITDRLIDMALDSMFKPENFAGLAGLLNFGGGAAPGAPMQLARGGPAERGRPYLVGERGPEMFVPNASGGIIPNSRVMAPARGEGGGNMSVRVFNSSGEQVQTRERRSGLDKEVEVFIGKAIAKGKFDTPMASRYGAQVKKTRRA